MIAIIGGGPSGCYAAYLLAKAGKEVSVFEEHNSIGKPVQCTGIVTSSINDIVRLRKELIVNKINRARIFSKENSVEVKLKNANLVLDREKFDNYLAEKAKHAGARIYLSHRFAGNGGKKVVTSKKTIEAEAIVGADGPLSKVAKMNNMFGKRHFWVGLQARAKLKNDNAVEFYPNIGTFAWVVPENKDVVRIGLFARKNAREIFNKFINKKTAKNSIIDYQAGLVPVYNPKQLTQKDHLYLLGDAACQVKATTGGGIIQGLTAAQALSDSMIRNRSYEKSWRKRLGKDLWLHLKMRKMMDKFNERDWQLLVSLFKKNKNKKILEEYDRDYPSRFILKLLLNEPRLVYFARRLL